MKIQLRYAMYLSALGGTLACACGQSYDTRPATTTSAGMTADNEHAVRTIAGEQCDRAVRCENVGEGKKYASRQQCVADLQHEGDNALRGKECAGGIDHPRLDRCVADIRADRCGNVADHLTRLAACRTGALCR